MNCKEFETRLVDGEMGDTALAHARSCDVCAARLVDTESLQAAFRVIAGQDATKQALERLEANLLAAFRQQATNVVVMPQSRTISTFQWSHWLLAAAAVAMVILLALFAWRMPDKSLKCVEARGSMPPLPRQITPAAPKYDTPPPNLIANKASKKQSVPKPGIQNASLPTNRNQTASPQPATDTGSNREARTRMEIATDFLPLPIGYSLPMTEGGQVMRVQLPRTALSSFGLPVDFNRASELIKADVVVGNDGIARAIRFVR